jgi:hypothetical protein
VSRLANAVPESALRAADHAPSGPGRPLDRATRASFEHRLGHDFARVRVHTDARAGGEADALRADAFTVGERIAFAPGRFAPGTEAGRRLLGHELAHVVQQRPGRNAPSADSAGAEREADAAARGRRPRLSRRPVAVHRQPASKTAAAGITRVELAQRLKDLVGHDVKITVGTKDQQTQEVRELAKARDPGNADKIDKATLPKAWKKWDPGATAVVYERIATAFADVRRVEAGLPDLQEIFFYDQDYVWDGVKFAPRGFAAAWFHSQTGRSKSDHINVFSAVLGAETPGATLLSGAALGRSTAAAQAQQQTQTGPAETLRTIAHELGHGIDFATSSIAEFEAAVGWYPPGSDTPVLYDLPAGGPTPGARQPPSQTRITTSNWNSGQHREQPISQYATTNPRDDFAESLAAFVYSPQVLKARSPARYDYFHNIWRRAIWQSELVRNEKAQAPEPKKSGFSWPTGGS